MAAKKTETDVSEDIRLVEVCGECEKENIDYHPVTSESFVHTFICECGHEWTEQYKFDKEGIIWPSYLSSQVVQ